MGPANDRRRRRHAPDERRLRRHRRRHHRRAVESLERARLARRERRSNPGDRWPIHGYRARVGLVRGSRTPRATRGRRYRHHARHERLCAVVELDGLWPGAPARRGVGRVAWRKRRQRACRADDVPRDDGRAWRVVSTRRAARHPECDHRQHIDGVDADLQRSDRVSCQRSGALRGHSRFSVTVRGADSRWTRLRCLVRRGKESSSPCPPPRSRPRGG